MDGGRSVAVPRPKASMDGGRSVAVPRPKVFVRSFHKSGGKTVIVSLLYTSIRTTETGAGGSVGWPTREYSKGLGFQSHRNESVCRARETNNERARGVRAATSH
jgi:hypothetical protein